MSFTEERLTWEDLEIFFHVAEAGGLSAASRRLGLSAPTLGRRVLGLEQRAGQTLFVRKQTGYDLTPAGRALMGRVRVMRAAAAPAVELLDQSAGKPLVRLSAGTGTAGFLADSLGQLWRPTDDFRLHFVTTEATLDIGHREADLAIRNSRPTSGNLASIPLATLRFAPFRSWSVPYPEQLGWVALDPAQARHPAAHWLHRQGHPISAMASAVATVHALVRAGAGIGVMPCMTGDRDPMLARAGDIIEELTEQQYLVMHDDDRHRPQVRRLIARITKLYGDNAALLAGERPLRAEPAL